MGLRGRPLVALIAGALVAASAAAAASGVARSPVPSTSPASHEPNGSATPGTRLPSTSSPAGSSTTPPGSRPTSPPGNLVLENGGTVTVAVPSLPADFNTAVPAGAGRVAAMIGAQVWPSPFVIGTDLRPVLDSSFVTSAYLTSLHPQTIQYTIAPGARWSDGRPITATDFYYFWREQLIWGPKLPPTDPLQGYEDIRSIAGSNGGRTVTVVFSQAYSDWEALFSGLVPAHVGLEWGFSGAFSPSGPGTYISGGPYQISDVVPGVEVVLTRNLLYWGAQAHVADIVFKVVRGRQATLAALRSGAVDVAEVSPGPDVSQLVASSDGTLAVGTRLSPVLWQLAFNLARPTLSVPALRRAIAEAIDPHEVVGDSAGLMSPGAPDSANRVIPVGAPGSAGHGPDGGGNDSGADSILVGLGYSLEPDGMVLTPSGRPLQLTLDLPAGSPAVAQAAAQIQAELLQAGITLHLRTLPGPELLAKVLPTGDYELALAPFPVTPFPSESEALYTDPVGPTPPNLFAASGATQTTLPGALPGRPPATGVEPGALVAGAVTRDVLGFSDPVVAALYQVAEQQLAPLAAEAAYNQVDRRMWYDVPTIPLFQMPVDLVTRADVYNVTNTDTLEGPMWDAEDWVIGVHLTPTTTSTTSTTTPKATTSARLKKAERRRAPTRRGLPGGRGRQRGAGTDAAEAAAGRASLRVLRVGPARPVAGRSGGIGRRASLRG